MDARIDWLYLGLLENTRIFVGEFEGGAHVLFYDVKKLLKINISTFRKSDNGISNELEAIISSHCLFKLDLPFSEINKIKIRIDDKPVSDDLIMKFIRLQSKIYPI